MKYLHIACAVFVAALMIAPNPAVHAQGATSADVGDPPIAALISISEPDANGLVTITGAPGAVFPTAEVAVRNLYTEDVVYTLAGITGTFNATIFGPGNTPFHISPTRSVPTERRNQPGSLPGGPGTIIYGRFPETNAQTPLPVTQLVTDGQLEDWSAYAGASVTGGFALQNQESLYIAQQDAPAQFARVLVRVSTSTATFQIVMNPFGDETAIWAEQSEPPRDLGTIAAVAAVADGTEIRIPLAPLRERLFTSDLDLNLVQIAYLDDNDNVLTETTFDSVAIVKLEEQDGFVYRNSAIDDSPLRFTVSGAVAQGASVWHANARINTLSYDLGDAVNMEMDVQLRVPDLPETLTGLQLIGRVGLLPVSDNRGLPISGALNGSNGWSTVMTPGGLAIENIPAHFDLGEVVVPAPQIIRQEETLLASFDIRLPIPDDLPEGTYVPTFEGYGQIGDSVPFRWSDNGIFGDGDGLSAVPSTRLPIVMNIGTTQTEPKRVLWTLFNDTPSNGSRGLMAEEDSAHAGLSNRVKFNSPTYILPPSTRYNGDVVSYAIEPYIPNVLPNRFDTSVAPLLPLLFPNGRMSATIQRPNGDVNTFSNAPVVQNMLSTDTLEESDNFGQNTQVDTYRVTTLSESFTEQLFEMYGEYTIELGGFVEDVWGNRYEGGGTYTFLVAEMMNLSPSVLPGTPFEVGDALNIGLHITPNVAAEVTVRLRHYPLDGGDALEQIYEGVANPYGVFQADTPFLLEMPGEYLIDYEARFTDVDGRLWAGSLRTAGIVASPQRELVLRGNRGVADANTANNPAWFFVDRFQGLASEAVKVFMPYNHGDVVWITDNADSGIRVQPTLQDLTGNYTTWLTATHPDYQSSQGTPLAQLSARDALPNTMLGSSSADDARIPFQPALAQNTGYTYVNFVQPHTTIRQMVLGSELGDISLDWSADDPLNQQIGAGMGGVSSGDYFFMFGGSVLRNEEAGVQNSAIYGAFASVISSEAERGIRITPPFRGGAAGPNGGALLNINGREIDIFFQPTAVRPGDVLEVGDVMSIAGQVAPTLPSNVEVTVTAPSGNQRVFGGTANTVGYFYDPTHDFAVDEIGVWTVQVNVTHTGRTSAGVVHQPFPTGSVLGATGGFSVYVVESANDKLPWTQSPQQDFSISPGLPFNIAFDAPTDWVDTTRYVTVRFPSTVIQDGVSAQPGSANTYQYNPAVLSQQFPFFERSNGLTGGAASSDPLYLTFVFTGTNADGEFDAIARQVVIRHDRLLTLE